MNPEEEAAKCGLIAETLRAGRRIKIRALGISMMPAIWPGDTLVIEPVPVGSLKVGQVVVFTRENRIFAHRLLEKHETALITRGDHMAGNDPEVRCDEYLGAVSRAERCGKSVILAERRGAGQRLLELFIRTNLGVAVFLKIARILGKTDYGVPKALADETVTDGE